MPLPLLGLALGGAALGALANPDDRKKGALLGLGAGLLAPVAAPGLLAAPAAAPVVAPVVAGGGTAAAGGTLAATGGTLAAPVVAGGGTAAGGTLAAGGTAGAATGTAGAATSTASAKAAMAADAAARSQALAANAAKIPIAEIQSIMPNAAIGPGGIAHTGTLGSQFSALGQAGLNKAQAAGGKLGEFIAAESPDVAKQIAVGGALSALTPKSNPQAPQAPSSALPGQASPQESLYERAAMNQQARMKKRQGAKRFI